MSSAMIAGLAGGAAGFGLVSYAGHRDLRSDGSAGGPTLLAVGGAVVGGVALSSLAYMVPLMPANRTTLTALSKIGSGLFAGGLAAGLATLLLDGT